MTASLTMTMIKVLATFIIILSVSGALAQDDDVPSCQPGDLFLPDPDGEQIVLFHYVLKYASIYFTLVFSKANNLTFSKLKGHRKI